LAEEIGAEVGATEQRLRNEIAALRRELEATRIEIGVRDTVADLRRELEALRSERRGLKVVS
jgi:hypothetical protein